MDRVAPAGARRAVALRRLVIGCIAGLTLLSCSERPGSQSEPLRVAVAANFEPVLAAWKADAERAIGVPLSLSAGATGALRQQIEAGAPFEVFLSADDVAPRALAAGGFARQESIQRYASGRLAIAFAEGIAPIRTLEELLDSRFRQIAIASEDTAPYGRAAMDALRTSGLLPAIEARIVRGQSVGQTYSYIRTGAADAAFVALSQVLAAGGSGAFEVPLDAYPEIAQDLVLIGSAPRAEAVKFAAWLKSPEIQERMRQAGYR